MTTVGSRVSYKPANTTYNGTVLAIAGGLAHVSRDGSTASHYVMPLSKLTDLTPPPVDTWARPGYSTLRFLDTFDRDIPEGSFRSMAGDKWNCYDDSWPDTFKGGVRDTAGISQSGGLLRINHKYGAAGKPMVPALQPRDSAGPIIPLTAGRYEIRCRADVLPNYYIANLLWPTSGVWPRDGEIDYPEGAYTENVGGFLHYQGGTSGGDQVGYRHPTAKMTDWHTYATEWQAGTFLRLYLDGVMVQEWTTRIPSTPMRWVIQTETTNGAVPPPSQTGVLLVEYAGIWTP